jgi:hypothetical protein
MRFLLPVGIANGRPAEYGGDLRAKRRTESGKKQTNGGHARCSHASISNSFFVVATSFVLAYLRLARPERRPFGVRVAISRFASLFKQCGTKKTIETGVLRLAPLLLVGSLMCVCVCVCVWLVCKSGSGRGNNCNLSMPLNGHIP